MENHEYICTLTVEDLLKIGLSIEDPCPMCSKHGIAKSIDEHATRSADCGWTPHFDIRAAPMITNAFVAGKSYKEINQCIEDYSTVTIVAIDTLKTSALLTVDRLKNDVQAWSEKARERIIRKKYKNTSRETRSSNHLDLDLLVRYMPDDVLRYIYSFIEDSPSVRLRLLEHKYNDIMPNLISKMTVNQLRPFVLNMTLDSRVPGFDSFYTEKGTFKTWSSRKLFSFFTAESIIKSLSKPDLISTVELQLSGWKPENIKLRVSERKIEWVKAEKAAIKNYTTCVIVSKMIDKKKATKKQNSILRRLERRRISLSLSQEGVWV